MCALAHDMTHKDEGKKSFQSSRLWWGVCILFVCINTAHAHTQTYLFFSFVAVGGYDNMCRTRARIRFVVGLYT